jgi:hypothetical protein
MRDIPDDFKIEHDRLVYEMEPIARRLFEIMQGLPCGAIPDLQETLFYNGFTITIKKEITMREVNIGTKLCTTIHAMDEPEFGANHEYAVYYSDQTQEGHEIASIKFQKGPVKENGKNGLHNEDLIAIAIDRLQGLNSGDFKCRENSLAITKLEEAMMWLNKRTLDRRNRGVEGTSTI